MKFWILTLGLAMACQPVEEERAAPSTEPFWWGVATSSYQVEDPGQDVFQTDWDQYYDQGHLKEHRGEGAGSWSNMERDRQALTALGVTHYRFSIEWARVEPTPGQYNTAAIAQYAEHAKALSEQGITPVVCLWHFTFPDWASNLEDPDLHGWLNPTLQDRWAEYVKTIVKALGPYVHIWAPQNEPNAVAMAGYFMGMWPPGVHNDLFAVRAQTQAAAARFIESAKVIRQHDPDAQILTVQNIIAFQPQSWDAAGVFTRIGHQYNFDHLDAVYEEADLIGFNYYYRRDASPFPSQEMMWPRGIRWAIETLQTRYQRPVVVTENGLGTDNDKMRQAYMRAHIYQVQAARSDGWDVAGYFAWSLVDNYEWALGWDVKYGLFAHENGELLPKQSAEVYRQMIEEDLVR